jgi:hypothetical protein
VTVKGVSIYHREGLCDILESDEPIFMALSRYKEPVRNLPANRPDEDLEQDPRNRA